jgi:heparan-alpha-glucosaminide N-acetyltransferase
MGPRASTPGPLVSSATAASRILAVDVLRGLVLLILLPDLTGGFSLHRVAAAVPESTVWALLASQFSHVRWTGVALWDLVMPLFVFMVGVSIPLADAKRLRENVPKRELLRRAMLRSAALFTLGMLLQFKVESRWDELLPLLVVSTGLPIERLWDTLVRKGWAPRMPQPHTIYSVCVLGFVSFWLLRNYRQLGHYEMGSQILALLGLAYLPAYLLSWLSLRLQAMAIALLWCGYGLAFMFWGWHTGVDPWAPQSHLSAIVDRAIFSALPRSEAYRGNAHDYHTLLFVPMIGSILFGALAGRWLLDRGSSRATGWRFVISALAGLALALLMNLAGTPLLKSLWTPTWAVFSSSSCLLMLGVLLVAFGPRKASPWTTPLVVLGTNSILLYVLVFTERWRFVQFWNAFFDLEMRASTAWWPLVESGFVMLSIWVVAYALHRAGLFFRL